MHAVLFRISTFIVVAAIILSGSTQKSEISQASASVSQNISDSSMSEDKSEETTSDLQVPEAMTNPDGGESISGDATSESASQALSEVPTFSQEPAEVDRSLPNEMTMLIVDKEGVPVRNI